MSGKNAARPVHITFRIPQAGPTPADGWIAETYRLLDAFECERRRTVCMKLQPAGSFVIAASDYLWARFECEARWDRFEVRGLFTLFAPFLAVEGWAKECAATLSAFFEYLLRTRVINGASARRIQSELAAV